MNCPVCSTKDVYPSHRKGVLERSALTWIGVLPYRCGHCRTRFFRFARKDPRRRRKGGIVASVADQPRPPRWTTNVSAVVTVCTPGQASVTLKGIAENASLEGGRLRLPKSLPEGSVVSVALEGVPSLIGSVRWTAIEGESVLHGIQFQVSLQPHGTHSLPWRRLGLRQMARGVLIVLIGSAAIATAAYGLVWLVESMHSYHPKYYEPKDIEREGHEFQRRLEELRRSAKP